MRLLHLQDFAVYLLGEFLLGKSSEALRLTDIHIADNSPVTKTNTQSSHHIEAVA